MVPRTSTNATGGEICTLEWTFEAGPDDSTKVSSLMFRDWALVDQIKPTKSCLNRRYRIMMFESLTDGQL